MKALNLILIGFFAVLLSSCSTDMDGTNGGGNSDDCMGSNGFLTADISGSPSLDGCDIGAVIPLSTGAHYFYTANIDYEGVVNTRFKNYLIVAGGLGPDKQDGCISNSEGEGAAIAYYEDVDLTNGTPEQEQDGYYSSDSLDDVEICFELLTDKQAIGTFSGILYNHKGEAKTVTNGHFDFQIQ